MHTFLAYRLPHQSEVHYIKGRLIKRSSITELMGRGIVLCDFQSKEIYQLEEITDVSAADWQYHYKSNTTHNTDFDDYRIGFEKLQEQIHSGRFEKIVLTRAKIAGYNRSPQIIFNDLCKNYLNTFNYLLSSPELGCWMGATPEKLCEINDNKVTAISLAGTKSKSEKWTDKEIEEQLYVTRYIEDKLRKLHCKNIQVDGPHNIQAGEVIHLKSFINGELQSREMWRKVIEDLHPTPATCGIPAEKSMAFIQEIEAHERHLYTGFIGIFEEKSKKCFVNLRCMQLFENEAVLYIGGGITAKSDIAKEWEETDRKAQTLEKFLSQ